MARRSPPVTEVEPPNNALERLVERALAAGAARAGSQVEKIRRASPDATPAELLATLERGFRRRVGALSAAVGLSAAVPGAGTVLAVALTGVNIASFLRASATFVSAAAHVHGVAVDDVARRRTLLLVSLLGHDGARALHGQLGVSTLYWGRGLLTRLPLGTVRAVNRGLSRRLARVATAKGGAVLLGRLAPFGIGAVIGWFVGRRLAKLVVTGARDAFGPPPAQHPEH